MPKWYQWIYYIQISHDTTFFRTFLRNHIHNCEYYNFVHIRDLYLKNHCFFILHILSIMASRRSSSLPTVNQFYHDPLRYNFEDSKYSLLIVGPSGAGKSAFCNFLLKEKRFTEAIGILAGTEKADYCRIPGKDGDMLVVDCPGFCDPKRPHEEIMKEISKAAILCRNGMDAIGIVVDPTSRFTATNKVCCEQMELFGGNFWKHSFVIFNHEKEIQEVLGFNDAREYIHKILLSEECPAEFKTLLHKVENRFIFVESSQRWNDEKYRFEIRDSINQMILQVKNLNGSVPYMNCFIMKAKTNYFPFNCMWKELDGVKNEQLLFDQKLKEFATLVMVYEAEISKLNEKLNRDKKCTIL